jgi:hypothetical protein
VGNTDPAERQEKDETEGDGRPDGDGGGYSGTANGVHPESESERDRERQADARDQAVALADSTDLAVGEPRSVSTGGGSFAPTPGRSSIPGHHGHRQRRGDVQRDGA